MSEPLARKMEYHFLKVFNCFKLFLTMPTRAQACNDWLKYTTDLLGVMYFEPAHKLFKEGGS